MRDIGVQKELLPHGIHSWNDQIIHLIKHEIYVNRLVIVLVSYMRYVMLYSQRKISLSSSPTLIGEFLFCKICPVLTINFDDSLLTQYNLLIICVPLLLVEWW